MAIIKKFRIKSFKNSNPLLELRNISISFGQRKILDNISFKINPGEILGLLGPNGAGKSTIFNLITGILKPDFGTISFGKREATNYPIYLRTREFKIGYVPQYGGYFSDLTAYENLKAIAQVLIRDSRKQNSKIEYLISKLN
jgi:ABC-type (unclassified) transport system, ATPase component